MRRCVRCKCWKPDAGFLTHDNGYLPGRCAHCRSILRELKNSLGRGGAVTSTSLPKPIERIAATPEGLALAMYAEAERRAFEARGAPRIGRPYVHDARGSLIGKRTRKKMYGGDFTGSTLGH